MTRFLGFLIVLFSIGLFIFASTPVQFYMLKRVDRLEKLWNKDIEKLLKNKDFADFASKIKNVEISFPDPQVAMELDDLVPPFKEQERGTLNLKIEIIRWIDQNQYGYVLQHDIFDNEHDVEEKLFEFGRTYKVGIFW